LARVARSLQTSSNDCRTLVDLKALPNNVSRLGVGTASEHKARIDENRCPATPGAISKGFVEHKAVTYSALGASKTATPIRQQNRYPKSDSPSDDHSGSADRGNFLVIGAHHYAANFPNLSRHFLRLAAQTFKDAHVGVDQKVKKSLCGFCGAVFVPGVSCRVRIQSSQCSEDEGFDQCAEEPMEKNISGSYLMYSCSCGSTTRAALNRDRKLDTAPTTPRADCTVDCAETTSSSKKRKRKSGSSLEKAIANLKASRSRTSDRNAASLFGGLFLIDAEGDSSLR